MKISYFSATFLSTAALLAYTLYTREQLYQIILFLVTSKVSYVILGNALVAMAFMSSSVVTGLFLGKLSESETEMLTDNGKYAITETCLALTIFRNDLTPPIIVLFFALLFLKSFHWLCRSRVDRLEQVMPFGYLVHLRLFTFVLLLGASNLYMCYSSCLLYTSDAADD